MVIPSLVCIFITFDADTRMPVCVGLSGANGYALSRPTSEQLADQKRPCSTKVWGLIRCAANCAKVSSSFMAHFENEPLSNHIHLGGAA
jgi:hypothetical protein